MRLLPLDRGLVVGTVSRNCRIFASVLASAVIVTALTAGTAQAQSDSTRAVVPSSEGSPAKNSVNRGYLFSAVSFADSSIGIEWSRLRPKAEKLYPGLKFTRLEDLHVTVVYIGGDWKPEDLDRIRAHALVLPLVPVRHTPEVVRMGRNNHVVVVELHGASSAWGDTVVAAKKTLNGLGLKKPESYDANFRPHITLAEARHKPPTAADSTELAGFLSWIRSQVAENPTKFTVTVGPTTSVRLLLAGTTRPEGAPEYVAVEDFLERQPVPIPKK